MMAKAYSSVSPCKGCTDRKVGCHATCALYKLWQDNGIEIKEPFIEVRRRRRRKK